MENGEIFSTSSQDGPWTIKHRVNLKAITICQAEWQSYNMNTNSSAEETKIK